MPNIHPCFPEWTVEEMSGVWKMNPRLTRRTMRLMRDERGTTGVLFGMMAIPLITLVGAAIDYGRAIHRQEAMQRIIDSATIAGLNEYRTSKDAAKAQARILAYVDAGLKNSGLTRKVGNNGDVTVSNASVDTITSGAAPQLASEINTIVLGIIGIESLSVKAETKVAVAAEKPKGTKALELSVVLDLSGSMQGQKMTDMKAAAQDFLDIVMPNDELGANRRVGLVPFSTRVNAGQFASAATGLAPTKMIQTSTTTEYVFSTNSFNWLKKSDCGTQVRQTTANSNLTSTQAQAYCVANFNYSAQQNKYYTPAVVSQQVPVYSNRKLYECVTERQGTNAYTDVSPSTSPVGWYSPSSGENSQYSSTGKCMMTPSDSYTSVEFPVIKELTTDKQSLKDHIATFRTFGNTAGHLATAWSWYMLSPEWNSMWPSTAQVTSYDDTETVKAAVIMTDGEYNNSQTVTSSSAQALALCNNMKAKGIRVYTIGFDMTTTSAAADLLRQCASQNSYYFPYDGTALRAAFLEIGDSLVNIVTKSADSTKIILQE